MTGGLRNRALGAHDQIAPASGGLMHGMQGRSRCRHEERGERARVPASRAMR